MTPSAEAKTGPTGSEAASPSPTTLTVGGWAEITAAGGLNLRERAGTDAPQIRILPVGAPGLIAAGPVEADGYPWYAFMGTGLSETEVTACDPSETSVSRCPAWFGWVAGADVDGTPWLAAAVPECPAGPTKLDGLLEIRPALRLACFAGQSLAFDAFIPPEVQGRGCYTGYSVTPAWLDPCAIAFLQGTETEFDAIVPELGAHVDPSLGGCDFGGRSPAACPFASLVGSWFEVEGHLGDPAAETCTAEPYEGIPTEPDPALVVNDCRLAFVVTAIRTR